MGVKQDRMGWRIRQILSELLLREVSDPRLHGVTITEVDLDPEMQFGHVYVNALGEELRSEDVLAGLLHAKGFLRREVGKRVRLRKTPDFAFHWDERYSRGEHLNQRISALDIPEGKDYGLDVYLTRDDDEEERDETVITRPTPAKDNVDDEWLE